LFKALKPGVEYFVCNPLTQERITLATPPRNALVCGFFFRELEVDYMVLSVFEDWECYRYMMFSLQTRCWRQLASVSYCHLFSTAPAAVDGKLHWMVYHCCPNLLFRTVNQKAEDLLITLVITRF
jgi:hypothetical protein